MNKFRYIFIITLVIACIFGITACKEDESKTDYMVLVNKQSKLPEDWESTIELVDVYTGLDETYQIEKKTALAYAKLRDDLRENDHVIIELDSTYRTVTRQQEIWDSFLKEHGEEYANSNNTVVSTSFYTQKNFRIFSAIAFNKKKIADDNNIKEVANMEYSDWKTIKAGDLIDYGGHIGIIVDIDYDADYIEIAHSAAWDNASFSGVQIERYTFKQEKSFNGSKWYNGESEVGDYADGHIVRMCKAYGEC